MKATFPTQLLAGLSKFIPICICLLTFSSFCMGQSRESDPRDSHSAQREAIDCDDHDNEKFEEEEDFEDEDEERDLSAQEIYSFMTTKFPEAYEELMLAQKEDSIEEFQAALERAKEFVLEYQEIASEDPEGADLFLQVGKSELKMSKLVGQYLQGETKSAREQFFGLIKKHAAELLDLQIQAEEHELDQLRKEVDDISQLIAERKANRKQEIAGLIEEYLEEEGEEEDE